MSYPDDWDERRRRVYRRDDHTCQNCAAKGGTNGDTELHAHHIVPKSQGGKHKLTNLVTLCEECHRGAHFQRSIPWREYTGPFWQWFVYRFGVVISAVVALGLWPVTIVYFVWLQYKKMRSESEQ